MLRHPDRRLILLPLLTLLLASSADAVNCRRYCRSTIKACINQECNPPAFGVPRAACVLGLRAGAIAACKARGPQACPKKTCPIGPE